MQTGKVTWISALIKSKNGGVFRIASFELFDGDVEKAQVYLNPENKNYTRWAPILEEGSIVTGLVWKNKEKRLIDGDSPVESL